MIDRSHTTPSSERSESTSRLTNKPAVSSSDTDFVCHRGRVGNDATVIRNHHRPARHVAAETGQGVSRSFLDCNVWQVSSEVEEFYHVLEIGDFREWFRVLSLIP